MRSGKIGKFAPGHQKILQELAARGALTKEEIAALIGNRNLAVKYRRDLQEWGLIRLVPRRVGGKTIDAYVLTPRGLEKYYAIQLFNFFEKALFEEEQTKPVLIVDPSGAVIIRENDLHNASALKQLFYFYSFRLPAELTRIRVMLSRLHDNLVLTQFGKAEREALANYRAKLKEMFRIYLEIWLRRTLKKTYGVGGSSLDEVLSEVIRIPPAKEELEDALLMHYRGELEGLDIVAEALYKTFEIGKQPNEKISKAFKAMSEIIIGYIIWQYDNVIVDLELLRCFLDDIMRDEEVAAEATEEEKARLQALYNDLTNPAMLRVYQEFLDKRARQPKELIITPSGGFRGYLTRYWQYASALGDQEEKKKVLEIFKDAIKMNLWTPFILYGMLPEPPFFKHVGEENEE
jgi:hypothetical protein